MVTLNEFARSLRELLHQLGLLNGFHHELRQITKKTDHFLKLGIIREPDPLTIDGRVVWQVAQQARDEVCRLTREVEELRIPGFGDAAWCQRVRVCVNSLCTTIGGMYAECVKTNLTEDDERQAGLLWKVLDSIIIEVDAAGMGLESIPAPPKPTKSTAKSLTKPAMSLEEANLKARDLLKGRPSKKSRWSVRSLAKAIGCSSGLVGKLQAWQAYAESNGLRNSDKIPRPNAMRLTDKVEANIEQEDAVLNQLIKEQQADFED